MSRNILLIDDDALLRRSLAFNLQRAGFHVQTEGSAEDGIQHARRETPDLVLLDIGLPGMDGLDALKIFRDQIGAPVIFLTARRRELDEVLGLELGADDYVGKPFDLDILLARIKAVLRRSKGGHASQNQQSGSVALTTGDLSIDPLAHTVIVGGARIDLSPKEFDLLYTLAARSGQLVTTDELLNQVWGVEYEGQPQVVYVHIRWLREKIEKSPNHPNRIVTVRSLGYKLIPQET
ncbi:MAG: response regulator transcription factor [Anaerolineaceae bacterium]|nr:response regulator transcription factor [Anaerolineaceae bacterium]